MSKNPETKKIPVVEFFGPTIQGEGAVIGFQTTFIRFGLCDYECTMCDSMHAVDPVRVKANAKWLTQDEILELIGDNMGCLWITFTGGNPAIHDLERLVNGLQHKGIKIAVETQGTLQPAWLSYCDVLTVSPKVPSMGAPFEEDKFAAFLYRFRSYSGLAIKVPVFDLDVDLEVLLAVNSLATYNGLADKVYISVGNPLPPQFNPLSKINNELGNVELARMLLGSYRSLLGGIFAEPRLRNVKILPQLHVLLWGNKQGV